MSCIQYAVDAAMRRSYIPGPLPCALSKRVRSTPSVAEQMLQDNRVTPVVRSIPAGHVSSITIADGAYTVTDETCYVGLGPGRYQSRYSGGTKEEVVARVEADGWQPSGRCGRSDGVAVNMWSRGYRDFGAPAELIAIWDETSQPMSLRK
jgi:hypothetical protein